MAECVAEDDLLDLARGGKPLGDSPAIETHLADCPACTALLATLMAESAADERRDLAGRSFGPYRLDARIGAGAMGEVYRGWDTRLDRPVAVKALSARFAESPERVRRLEAEARAAAAVSHPNVVTVYDVGAADGVPFIVSELIHGETLRSLIDRGPIARGLALGLAAQLARGLAAAHARGVVHRDLKPGNLIVTDDGTLKILDFGLAKLSGGERALDETEPGTLVGTSGYLSPEQARGEPADARSDLFAVGAILYELLAGQRAFGGATFAERLSAVLRDTPPPLDDPAWAIVARCLEKDPRKRFQSATDLAWVLDAQLRPEAPPPAPARPRARVDRRTFVAGVLAAGAGGALLGRLFAPRGDGPRVEYRQHTFRQGRVASARFTADGGSLLHCAAWDDLPLALFTSRIGGGGTRPLELPGAQLLAVSSRGELALSLEHRFIEGFHARGRLALAPLEGGAPQELGLEVQHADFTPDGAELAIVRRVGARFRLELPAGRVLAEDGWLSCPRVSPDGARVAYLTHDTPFDDRGTLMVVDRAGGAPRRVGPMWSSVDGVAWDRRGGGIWISASREGGNNGVRRLDLDGRVLARLPSAGRLRLHDVAADGRLAMTQVTGRMRMMVRAPGASEDVDLALSDVSLVADLSPDGETVAFAEFGDVDTANGAYVRPTRGGPAQRLGQAVPLDLAEDGREILATAWGMPVRLLALPNPAGAPRELPVRGVKDIYWARWCARGRIILGGAAEGHSPRLWSVGRDGAAVPVTDEGVFAPAAVSPDGAIAALVLDGRLLLVPVDGGVVANVPGTYVDERVCGWQADGRALFVRSGSPAMTVSRVEVATGARAEILRIDPPRLGRRGVDALVVSADGRAYVYSYGQELSRLFTAAISN